MLEKNWWNQSALQFLNSLFKNCVTGVFRIKLPLSHGVQKFIGSASRGQPGVEVEQPAKASAALDGIEGRVVVARHRLWVNESTL